MARHIKPPDLPDLPDDLPPEVREILEQLNGAALASGAFEGIDIGVVTDPLEFLRQAMSHVTPTEIVQTIVGMAASAVLDHSIHDTQCPCTPEEAWERWFDMLDDIVQQSKDALYPQFLEKVEVAKFEHEVTADLDALEVTDFDELFPEASFGEEEE